MQSYRAKYFLGKNLDLFENVELFVDGGLIVAVEELSTDLLQNNILMPAFYNAHTHAADIGIRGVEQYSLDELVGSNSIKSRYLRSLSSDDLLRNISLAQHEHLRYGTLGYTDFREGGLIGVQVYTDLHSVVSALVLGRPESLEVALDVLKFGGIGIRDVVQYPIDTLLSFAQLAHDSHSILQIHAGEDFGLSRRWEAQYGIDDVLWSAKYLHPTAIVHTNVVSDYTYLQQHNIGVILCLRSNLFTSTPLHTYDALLDYSNIALGTDNGMFFPFDMWSEMQVVMEHTPFSARQILQMATINGSRMVGSSHELVVGNVFRALEITHHNLSLRHFYDDLLKQSLKYRVLY